MKRLLFLLLILNIAPTAGASRVEIRRGQFFLNNEPFYVRGVGYAPWRPHQHPGVSYVDTNRRWTDMDFARMKAAHFNTIRTWDAFDPEELALAQKYGLMVIQGIRLDTRQDFSDIHNQESAVAQVQAVAEQSKGFDNVLGYLIMTEPWPEAVVDTGEGATLQYFRRLKRSIQTIDPRPVSMDSWTPLAFLDQHDFDFVTFNIFAFWPKSLNHALGLAGLTRWFADRYGADRPFIVGETGGYAVSKSTVGAIGGGAGGLTEYNQSLKDLDSLRDTVEGHAAGSVLVSWIDTWHYPADPDVHNDEPWEWDGLLGIATDSTKDMDGVPRQVVADVSAYNEVIVLEPKADHFYAVQKPVQIQAYGADNITEMQYNLNDGDWTPLSASEHGWFEGFLKLPKLARKRQSITIQALDADGKTLAKKQISFIAALQPEQVTLESKASGGRGGLSFSALVRDSQQPIAQRKVDVGCFYPISMRESQATIKTDAAGRVAFQCTVAPQAKDVYVFVAAGTDSPERVRAGDMRIYQLGR
jgi:hypothetical protein